MNNKVTTLSPTNPAIEKVKELMSLPVNQKPAPHQRLTADEFLAVSFFDSSAGKRLVPKHLIAGLHGRSRDAITSKLYNDKNIEPVKQLQIGAHKQFVYDVEDVLGLYSQENTTWLDIIGVNWYRQEEGLYFLIY